MWWVSIPPRMGEPGTTEFGSYDHGTKYGVWYKLDTQGDLIAIESFRNNVLDGQVKYYDRGRLYCTGHYRGLNPRNKFDTIMVMDPITHNESYKVIAADQGTVRHGTFQYFNPYNGHLIKEEEYQVDELVFKKDYEISANVDSIYLKQHEQRMPHKTGARYTPPPGKKVSYTD
jgi:antitoxin component YwqK of YwqJK toxin-antitoxin module